MTDLLNLKEKVRSFAEIQPWNHNFVLPDGTETRKGDFDSPAKNMNKLRRLENVFEALKPLNKKIIDIGCNEGFFSIELAKRGAVVTGIDVDSNRIKKAKFIKEILANDLPITYKFENFLTDDIGINDADLVLCLGFLHRVPDPITAIERLSKLGNTIIFEWKAQYASGPETLSATFTNQKINQTDTYGTEYWLLSVDSLKKLLGRNGIHHTYLLPNPGGKREILVASKIPIDGLITQNERARLFRGAFRLLKDSIKTFYAGLTNAK